jgi:CubicO group peptidase (beta-lactamase class C family)
MSEFETLLAKVTVKGNAKVHGAIFKAVDKNGSLPLPVCQRYCLLTRGVIGKELYSKVAGYDSLAADALPLREDAVLKMASCTKLITSIALLQCVERGLLGLDEPLTKVLPELDGKEILSKEAGKELTSRPSKTKITARHLLSHTSGLGYLFLDPLLRKWSKDRPIDSNKSKLVEGKHDTPLVFEPGNGWAYGSSLDWAGVVVRRLNNGITLENFFIENIWKAVGLSSPFPTFALVHHPEYRARLMQAAERTSDGGLKPWNFPYGDDPEDQEGGAGLVATTQDYIAVLTDLISDSPKLLKPETISLMYTPQLAADSPAIPMLYKLRPAWDHVSGEVSNDVVNHGLGGLLVLGGIPETGQPGNILAWGGATNPVWFACRELGVAGFFATQITPFADPAVKALVNAWRKEFWGLFNARK